MPTMIFESMIAKKKSAIIKKWFNHVVNTYPAETSKFLKRQKDPFSNPVGQTTLHGLEAIYDELYKGMERKTIISFLDPIIRIRAIQNFTPSQATGFIFALKKIINDHLKKEILTKQYTEDFNRLSTRIDELGLIGFDIYMSCREKIFQLQANDTKNRTYNAFKRAGLIVEPGDSRPDE